MSNHASDSGQPPNCCSASVQACHSGSGRRGFILRALAAMVGAFVGLVPFASGLAMFLDPLRRKGNSGGYIRVSTLDAVPDDGIPRQYPVVANRTDAWNFYPRQPIGAVYLCRQSGQDEYCEALNATCPHAGCFVDFSNEQGIFICPCHNSTFQIDGQKINPSPSPRSMDELDCDVRTVGGVKEVWVKFENFYTGFAEQIRKS